MGILSEPFRTTVAYRGRIYQTRPAFNVVLAVQRLYRDESLMDHEKCLLALRNLVRLSRFTLASRPLSWCYGLMDEVYRSQIALPERHTGARQERVLDFELDGEYIYASFLQDYGMDLIREQGRLHWKKFIWLFQGLSEGTKIKEVMRIRGMEEPNPNKYNQKEIQRIRELKSYYALPAVGSGGQEGLNRLFSMLEAQAVRNG